MAQVDDLESLSRILHRDSGLVPSTGLKASGHSGMARTLKAQKISTIIKGSTFQTNSTLVSPDLRARKTVVSTWAIWDQAKTVPPFVGASKWPFIYPKSHLPVAEEDAIVVS